MRGNHFPFEGTALRNVPPHLNSSDSSPLQQVRRTETLYHITSSRRHNPTHGRWSPLRCSQGVVGAGVVGAGVVGAGVGGAGEFGVPCGCSRTALGRPPKT
jgi:hypothetical protein